MEGIYSKFELYVTVSKLCGATLQSYSVIPKLSSS